MATRLEKTRNLSAYMQQKVFQAGDKPWTGIHRRKTPAHPLLSRAQEAFRAVCSFFFYFGLHFLKAMEFLFWVCFAMLLVLSSALGLVQVYEYFREVIL